MSEGAVDWSKGPFFLPFGEGPAEQRRAFEEKCAELGVDAKVLNLR